MFKSIMSERAACRVAGFSRATYQRMQNSSPEATQPMSASELPENLASPERHNELRQRRKQKRALTEFECQALLHAVHEPRFIDRSAPAIYSILLDEGRYYGSLSTIYRVMRRVGEVGERRDQATRPAHVKPELCATAPNQVYAWDITKLHGPRKWTYFYLYTVIDIYSRYVVGWMVADRESSELARHLLAETVSKHHSGNGPLTIHADRGSSMTSKPVAFLLADLGITKSHSRPRVSNDNPHIESLFKTVKYQPTFPKTFSSIFEARAFSREFFDWYNTEHRHSGIAMLTPFDVHYGRVEERIAQRQATLDSAYDAHPERFVRGRPRPLQLASASYINRPVVLGEEAISMAA